MAKFIDLAGREWNLALNVGLLAAFRKVGFDLKKDTVGERLGEIIFLDPERLMEIVWLAVKQQAEKVPVTADDFACAFDAETCQRASLALIESIVEFWNPPAAAAKIKAGLPAMLAELDAKSSGMVDRAIAKALVSIQEAAL